MQYKLYTTSVKAWDAMLRSIDQAKKSIYLEMYIFEGDTRASHDFIGKLKQKAAEGLRVVVVADAFGSKLLKKEIENANEKSQIEFIFFSHWLRHIHRKVLIVDEKIAFMGGVNIGKRFTHWNDLQLKVGGRIVKTILRSFSYTYEMAGGRREDILLFRKGKFTTKLKFWLIEHWPTKNIYTLKSHYIEKITGAQKTIQIATPYFTPPRWMISLLDDAIRRGVKVEILIPKEVDWHIMNLINYRYMRSLHPLGIQFYLSETMNHAKMLIIDEEEGLIGSQNLDLLSFQLNSEMGIFFKETKLLNELSSVFERWKTSSTKFHPENYKMKLLDYAIMALSKILRPML